MNVMNGTAVLTSFNVSDTNQTVVINMEPTRNVSLQLLLGAGAPPNHTRYNHSTILKPTGVMLKSSHYTDPQCCETHFCNHPEMCQ